MTSDRWLRKVARELDRARLKRARENVRAARKAKQQATRRARAVCARARRLFRRWVARERVELRRRIAEMRAQLKTESERRRKRVKACCSREHAASVRAQHDTRINELRAQLERETRLQTDLKRRKLEHPPAGNVRKERRAESDHEVEVNLSPDELIVFRRVRKLIQPTDRMSRTESFQHWAHEHSAEVARILADDAEQAYQRAVREEAKQRKQLKKTLPKAQLAAYVREQLADVPF